MTSSDWNSVSRDILQTNFLLNNCVAAFDNAKMFQIIRVICGYYLVTNTFINWIMM